MLSQANKNFPFILNIGLFVVGGVLAYLAGEASRKRELAAALETEAALP
jgi:uncharacterized protein (UPF0333 family)